MRDVPSGHRTDTEWFAVDGEGHLGLFSPGEEGAVPVESPFDRAQGFAVLDRLEAFARVRDQALGRLAAGEDLEESNGRCVVLFEARTDLGELTRQRGVTVLEVVPRRFVATLPEAPVCLSVSEQATTRTRDRIRAATGYLGSWAFSTADLPEDLRARLGLIRLDRVRFAAASGLQLADHDVSATTPDDAPLRDPDPSPQGTDTSGDPYRSDPASDDSGTERK